MKLSEYISRMWAIQDDMYDGGKPSVEELIETKRKDLDKNIRLLKEKES